MAEPSVFVLDDSTRCRTDGMSTDCSDDQARPSNEAMGNRHHNKKLRAAVRATMARTGESYQTVLARLRSQARKAVAGPGDVDLIAIDYFGVPLTLATFQILDAGGTRPRSSVSRAAIGLPIRCPMPRGSLSKPATLASSTPGPSTAPPTAAPPSGERSTCSTAPAALGAVRSLSRGG